MKILSIILMSLFILNNVFADDADIHNKVRQAVNNWDTIELMKWLEYVKYDFSLQPRPVIALEDMTESQELKDSSKEYSEQCIFAHSDWEWYWENIFVWTWKWTLEDAVKSWSYEVEYYNYWLNVCKKWEMCGHYTQVIWNDTLEVWCNINACGSIKDANWNILYDWENVELIVCQYKSQGNIIWHNPYKEKIIYEDAVSVDDTSSDNTEKADATKEVDDILDRIFNNVPEEYLCSDDIYNSLEQKQKFLEYISSNLEYLEEYWYKSSKIFPKKELKDLDLNIKMYDSIRKKVDKIFKKTPEDIDLNTINAWVWFLNKVEKLEELDINTYPKIWDLSSQNTRDLFVSLYYIIWDYYLAMYYDNSLNYKDIDMHCNLSML